jgi:acetyltransferase
VIAADACEESGFDLTDFHPDFLAEIESHFRAQVIKLSNPLDLGDLFDYEVYTSIVEKTLQEDTVDGIVFLHTYFAPTEGDLSRSLFRRLEELSFQYEKPIAICVSTEQEELSKLKKALPHPVFTTPTDAIKALELLHRYALEHSKPRPCPDLPPVEVDRDQVREILGPCLDQGRNPMLDEAVRIFRAYSIPVVEHVRAASEEAAVQAAGRIGYPVAMKVISDDISHKSDMGGVQLNLKTDQGVRAAHADMMRRIRRRLPDAEIEGVLVQPMILEGRELILGARQDRQFGPVVLLGMGGIFVEIFREFAIRVVPFSREEAMSMFADLRTARILEGARGQEPYDLESVVDCLIRLAHLTTDFPEILEVDINPIRILRRDEGAMALDARIILDTAGKEDGDRA